ncbi:MAG: hypothetical protein Q7S83_01340 [bacterium]|nr:hypothetical protein [bacterium]
MSNPQTKEDKQQLLIRVALIILIGSLAFGVGYLIRGEVKKSPIIIEKNS